jgi:hypothetical protein
MPNLCFCIRWDLRARLCISVRPGHETLTHYFSCSGGTGTDLTKRAPGHIMLNLCFFASGGVCGSYSALLCIQEAKCRRTNFHARERSIRIWQKARKDTLRQTCVFSFRRDLWVT